MPGSAIKGTARNSGLRTANVDPELRYTRRRWLRAIAFLLLLTVAPYAMVTLMLTFLQRSLIFQPYRAAKIVPAELQRPAGGAHTVEVRSHDGLVLRGWHVLPRVELPTRDRSATRSCVRAARS
jgi:hypothetical protein